MKNTIFLLLGTLPIMCTAQSGYSSASMGMSQSYSQHHQAIIPKPQDVVMEEYMNYHRHKLPMPAADKNVGIDASWSNVNGETFLQVGFTTNRLTEESNYKPVNICLVIDRSGSMSGDKMEKTKQAMATFVRKLRPQDIISIVEFDTEADAILPATNANNLANMLNAIEKITARGGTDLDRGILLGYKELVKNVSTKYANRLVILTDAMTNTGELSPARIVEHSEVYKEEYDIDFALIGVGVDFNNELSRKLTEKDRCQIHFIHDVAQIEKVFNEEAEALLSPVAKEIELQIEIPTEIVVEQVYGYTPVVQGNKMLFTLKNMNAGLTQIFLFKIKEKQAQSEAIKVQVTYFDIQKNKDEVENIAAFFPAERKLKTPAKEIEKNIIIAQMAQALKEMAILYEKNEVQAAKKCITDALNESKESENWQADVDVKRMQAILEKYAADLKLALK